MKTTFRFRYVVECNKNGQVCYLADANDDFLAFTLVRACAKQFEDRDEAVGLCKRILASKRLSVKKAKAEKIGLGREVTYVN